MQVDRSNLTEAVTVNCFLVIFQMISFFVGGMDAIIGRTQYRVQPKTYPEENRNFLEMAEYFNTYLQKKNILLLSSRFVCIYHTNFMIFC